MQRVIKGNLDDGQFRPILKELQASVPGQTEQTKYHITLIFENSLAPSKLKTQSQVLRP